MKKIDELLKGVNVKEIYGETDRWVKHLTLNSKDVKEGSIFFAVRGENRDGHDFIIDAHKRGCRIFVVERKLKDLKDSTFIITDNVRLAFSKMSANFFDNPSEKLNVYGITGSTGKTTLIHSLRKTIPESGSIGSEGEFIRGKTVSIGEGLLTTPEAFEIHRFLRDCLNEDIKNVFLEVSSFALMNSRVEDVNFKGGIFLNLNPTHHLMIHRTILNYLKAKLHLLDLVDGPFIVNLDDPYHTFFEDKKKEILFYSKRERTHFFVKEIRQFNNWFLFKLNLLGESIDIKLKNKANIDIVLPLLSFLKVFYKDPSPFIERIEKLENPSGRWEILNRTPLIVVDKCNTPLCFQRINELFPYVKRKVLVFSFFEEEDIRETVKIFMLVKKIFNFVVVTSDDTKKKTPFLCNRNFVKLLKKGGVHFKFIEDRKEAIRFGISIVNKDDGLFILGRGDESFMLIRGNRVKYSDVETVKEIINGD